MSSLLAGASRTVITPPLGIGLAGSFFVRYAEHILDDLYVHALVLDDGSQEIALVSIDNCVIMDELVRGQFLPVISQMSGIAEDRIILAATHTHQGPYLHGHTEDKKEAEPYYIEYCVKQAATAVRMAQKKKVPVRIGTGRAVNEGHVFNRRLRRRSDGQIIMNWVNPDLLKDCEPSGPVDPEMLVASLEDEKGQPVALIVNYGNHNNIASGGVTADIAGQIRINLAKLYGEDMVVLFLLGPSGNTNALDHRIRRPPDQYKKAALSLTGTVLEIMSRLDYVAEPDITFASQDLQIQERPYCAYDVHEDDTFGANSQAIFGFYRQEMEKHQHEPLPWHRLSLKALRIGELGLVTNPAELFCDFGLAIKSQSPLRFTMVSELTNGCCGYVPTQQAFSEGGYEVRKNNLYSYLAHDAGDRIARASVDLLKKVSAADKRP